MGAGASAAVNNLSKLDKDAARAAAGAAFDEAAFDAAADAAGHVSKAQFLQAMNGEAVDPAPSAGPAEAAGPQAAHPPAAALSWHPSAHPSGLAVSPAASNLPPRWVVARWVKEYQKDFKEADLEVKAARRDEALAEKLQIQLAKAVSPTLPKQTRLAMIASDSGLTKLNNDYKGLTKCIKKKKAAQGLTSCCKCAQCRIKSSEVTLSKVRDQFRNAQELLKEINAVRASADLGIVLQEERLLHRWERDVGVVLRQTVGALVSTDFPMRLVFLDKSGSMYANRQVLNYGYSRAATPTSGSTLTFMLAGPGETQFMFTRAGAAAPANGSLQLGSATWFNEPVIRTLAAIAPAVENLLDEAKKAGQSLGIHSDAAEPPLQVLCITDGMDNCSPMEIGDLYGVVAAIRGLTGPQSGRSIYEPLSPLERSKMVGNDGVPRVPVWLMWVAVGLGGRQFAEDGVPGAVTLVDATELTTTDSPIREKKIEKWEIPVPDIDAPDSVRPGHLVTVGPTDEEDDDVDAPKSAIVLEEIPVEEEKQVLVLYTTGGTEEVVVTRCARVMPPAPPKVASKSVPSAEQRDAILNAAFSDQRALARAAVENRQTGEKVVPASAAAVSKAPEETLVLPDIEDVKYEPLPTDYVVSMMRRLGHASRALSADDRVLAQRIAASVLAEIMQSRSVLTGNFAERYAPRIGFDLRPNHKVCGPALALLEQLAELGVLKTAEKPLRSRGAPSTPPGDEPQKPETQLAYTAWDPCVPALAVALRLLQLRESRCKFYVPEGGDEASRPATPEVDPPAAADAVDPPGKGKGKGKPSA